MDTRLNVFHKVGKLKSFSKAAEVLNLTQPAITFQIKHLEEEFKARLFNRDQNMVTFTEPGKILFKCTEKILHEYEKAKHEIEKITGLVAGEIRIGVASLLGKYLLPKLIGIFQQQYPDINITMLVGNSSNLIQQIQEHMLDLIIVSEPVPLQNYIVRSFIDDEIIVIVNPGHKWAQVDYIEVEDFLTEPFIAREYGSGLREVFRSFLSARNISMKNLNTIMTLGSSESIKSSVEGGAAFSIISDLAVKREIELGLLKQVKAKGMNLKRRFVLVYPVKEYGKRITEVFKNFLLSQVSR